MSKNPYKVIEKAGEVAWWVVAGLFVAAALGAVALSCVREGWGWWTLLLIPGIPLGLIALGFIAALLGNLTDKISDRWQEAKWRWDDRTQSPKEPSA